MAPCSRPLRVKFILPALTEATSPFWRPTLKSGYDWAYREFYRWPSILRGAFAHGTVKHRAKHFFYAAGWKKFERLWDGAIRARELRAMTPLLEGVLSRVSRSAAVPLPAAPAARGVQPAAHLAIGRPPSS